MLISSLFCIFLIHTVLSIQWILLAVLVPLLAIIIAILTTLLILCLVAKKCFSQHQQHQQQQEQQWRQLQTPLQITNIHVGQSERKSKQLCQLNTRKSEHIYDIPHWSRARNSNSSMLYNQAYQDSFTFSVNAAYSSSLEV